MHPSMDDQLMTVTPASQEKAMATKPTTESRQPEGWRDNVGVIVTISSVIVATFALIVAIFAVVVMGFTHLDEKIANNLLYLDGKIDAQSAELRQANAELRQTIENQGANTANSFERLYSVLFTRPDRREILKGREAARVAGLMVIAGRLA